MGAATTVVQSLFLVRGNAFDGLFPSFTVQIYLDF